ncbi:MAG: RAMP superfamily CRISPR-associated protein [Candidatus Zixiibacteriota bacterium]
MDNLTDGSGKYAEITDVFSRILLLNTAFGRKDNFPARSRRGIAPKDYARLGERGDPSGLKFLIHPENSTKSTFDIYLDSQLSDLTRLGVQAPVDISTLPKGSWVIEFPVTLATPFLSKDDTPLYIIENPVRKDKVFAIPFISPMAWKGILRWTMMKAHLEPVLTDPVEFAKTRFRHTLLFGTEKGMEDIPKGWAEYLDKLCDCDDAQESYRDKLKRHEKKDEPKKDVPHLVGMLHFYPTFWDRLEMTVINPHDRRTKTGTNPIYFERVSKNSKGFFRLIYVPLHWIGLPERKFKENIFQDLQDVVAGLEKMMLTYGFSAKRSTGYGLAKDGWDTDASALRIKGFIRNSEKFRDFGELKTKVNKLREGVAQ